MYVFLTGYMEVYEDTFEKITFMIKKSEEGKPVAGGKLPDDEDAELDMFGEAFDEKTSATADVPAAGNIHIVLLFYRIS